jgi:hypothetical protein
MRWWRALGSPELFARDRLLKIATIFSWKLKWKSKGD